MQAIGDVRLAMEGAFETTVGALSEGRVAPSLQVWQRPAPAMSVALTLIATTSVAVWILTRPDVMPADLIRFVVTPADTAPMAFSDFDRDLAISPDGTLIVYTSDVADERGAEINLRPIDQVVAAPSRGTEGGYAPFVSFDGEWVGFVDAETESLQRVSILGGPPVTLAEVPHTITNGSWAGASWGADNQIIAGTFGGGLFRVPAGGGTPESLTTVDTDRNEISHVRPFTIPGHDAVVFAIRDEEGGQLAVLDLRTRAVTHLGLAGGTPHYVSTGHLVYAADDGSLRAVPFDATSLEVTGSPVPVVEDVIVKRSGAANFSISDNGRLIYVVGSGFAANPSRSLVWFDHRGEMEPVGLPPDNYRNARLSPSGTHVSLSISRQDNRDVWVSEIGRNTLSRLTTDPARDFHGVWLPDGERIIFSSERHGGPGRSLFSRSSDGTGPVEHLVTIDDATLVYLWGRPVDSDRRVLTSNGDVTLLSLDGQPALRPILDSEALEVAGTVSPDGRWIAYQSDETGDYEIYVQRFPDGGQRQRISTAGGWKPLWSPAGDALFYVDQNALMSVAVETDEPFAAETPTLRVVNK